MTAQQPYLRRSGTLMLWAVGAGKPLGVPPLTNDTGGAAVVVAESADALDRAATHGVVDESTRLFVRDDLAHATSSTIASAATTFQGRFDAVGTEVRMGDTFRLQVQSYAVSEFLSIVGPTLIRITDADDLATLVADAESCVVDGVFPDFLTNPAVQLADIPAISGDGLDQSGPANRLWLGEDAVSTSPWGAPLDGPRLADLHRHWSELNAHAPHRDAVALAKAVPTAEGDAILERPDELRRFLTAVSAVRALRARGMQHVCVSGYGMRVNDALAPHAHGSPRAVTIAVSDDAHFLVDTDTGRAFGVSPAFASAADALLTVGSVNDAAEFSPREQVVAVADLLAGAGVAL